MILSARDYAFDLLKSNLYRETHGPNRSPALDALCKEFGVDLGSSWCALIISKIFKLAYREGHGEHFHYTAGSQDMLSWFKKKGWFSDNPQDLSKWKGALIIRTDPGGEHGHVGLVYGRFTDNTKKIISLGTVEGNTNTNGSSNGDGMYERKRKLPLTPYTWTFCDTTHISGGCWWQ